MEYISAKTIVNKTKSTSWFGTSYNMNIYRGCSHGCIYCDSRSLCYRIDNFSKVRAKKDAVAIINKDLASKRETGIVGTGSMSDPYNPFERRLELTKGALEAIYTHGFGLSLITKSDLILRDIELFKDIEKFAPTILKITITTTDDNLAKKIEPRVSTPTERFKALEKMSSAGLSPGILLVPVLPFITDDEKNIIDIVKKGKEAGVKFINAGLGMTLREGNREYYYEKLEENFVGLKRVYESKFGLRYSIWPDNAKKLSYIFKNQCEKEGILYKMKDIVGYYKRKYDRQVQLF